MYSAANGFVSSHAVTSTTSPPSSPARANHAVSKVKKYKSTERTDERFLELIYEYLLTRILHIPAIGRSAAMPDLITSTWHIDVTSKSALFGRMTEGARAAGGAAPLAATVGRACLRRLRPASPRARPSCRHRHRLVSSPPSPSPLPSSPPFAMRARRDTEPLWSLQIPEPPPSLGVVEPAYGYSAPLLGVPQSTTNDGEYLLPPSPPHKCARSPGLQRRLHARQR